jgi:lipoprotein-anchoring transpeptidase ErfK/SrfK
MLHFLVVLKLLAAVMMAALLLSPESVTEPRPDAGATAASDAPEVKAASAHANRARNSDPQGITPPMGIKSSSRHFKVFGHPTDSGRPRRIAALNPIDQRLVLLVRRTREVADRRWYKVLLPDRPNGSTGWVRSEDVRPVRLRQRIRVDLSEHSLSYARNGHRIARLSVAIGAPATPTPTGTFYVWARVPQPNPRGAYGVYALGLSGFSVLSDWPGGGRAAIHGTADPNDRGQDVSHGCVRVLNSDMRTLMSVPMGTPVTIRA